MPPISLCAWPPWRHARIQPAPTHASVISPGNSLLTKALPALRISLTSTSQQPMFPCPGIRNNRGLSAFGVTLPDEGAAPADRDHQALSTQDAYRRAHRAAGYSLLLLEVALARQERTRLQLP